MIQSEFLPITQAEPRPQPEKFNARELIPAPHLIRFTSTQELVCGLMMKKYLPNFDLIEGDTYQIEIGRKRAVDFAFKGETGKRNILFEYHPIILHQEFRDRADYKSLKVIVKKLPEVWQQQSLLHALNEEFGNLYIERRTALIRASYFKHIREDTILITALSPEEFIDKVIVPFGEKSLVRIGRKQLLAEWNHNIDRFRKRKNNQVLACGAPLSVWSLDHEIIFETTELLSEEKKTKLELPGFTKRDEYASMVTLYKLIPGWYPETGKSIEYPIGAGAKVNFCVGDTLLQLSFSELSEYFYSTSRYDLIMQISRVLPREDQAELLAILNREYRRQYEKRYQQLVATSLDPRVHNRKLLCIFSKADLFEMFFEGKITRRQFEVEYRKALHEYDELKELAVARFSGKLN